MKYVVEKLIKVANPMWQRHLSLWKNELSKMEGQNGVNLFWKVHSMIRRYGQVLSFDEFKCA